MSYIRLISETMRDMAQVRGGKILVVIRIGIWLQDRIIYHCSIWQNVC